MLGRARHRRAERSAPPADTADAVTEWRASAARLSGSDAHLAVLARTGDLDAFTVLIRRHDPAMRRLAYRLLGSVDATEDALQDAYLRAFRGLASYREDAEFGSWLYRVTYNACMVELRRIRRRPVAGLDSDDVASLVPGPERAVTAADTVRSALAALPVDQRATVLLVDGEGLDNRAAAEILGVAAGTVGSRLSRARASMRRAIEEADHD